MTLKSIYFPKKEFSTKEEMFKAFRSNVNDIIEFKKAEIQKSCDKGISVSCRSLDLNKYADQVKGIKIDSNYYYIAANTTGILDGHEDLHVKGIWNKSVKEQIFKNYLVADHELCIDNVIVKKEYVEMFVVTLPFSALGFPYEGDTEVLVYKVPKDKIIHQKAKEWLESGDAIEASVRMQYVTILFAMDSNAPEDASLKKNYDDYLPFIANKGDFEYIPYYFIIKEAKNVRESSLVVFASNPVTGKISERLIESLKNTPTIDPPTSSQKSVWDYFI